MTDCNLTPTQTWNYSSPVCRCRIPGRAAEGRPQHVPAFLHVVKQRLAAIVSKPRDSPGKVTVEEVLLVYAGGAVVMVSFPLPL